MRLPLIALAATLACAREAPPPVGQLVLHIDTDAPLPPAPGEPRVRVALFDALRIDVLADGRAIPGLSREFAVDEGLLRERRASIGVVAAPGQHHLSARVRLYRYARQVGGVPSPRTTLETTVRLPPIAPDTIVHVATVLRTDDVGRAIGYPDPVEPEPFAGAPSLVGTFPFAAQVPCAGSSRTGEVCVPGGAYWFGASHASDEEIFTLSAERLTVVSPFYVDATEMTFGAYEALRALHPGLAEPSTGPACSSEPDAPIDCVSFHAARAACEARAMTLPTEAQWEWLASGLGADTEWPWGNEAPRCGDASFGLATECPGNQTLGKPGSFPRDRITPIPGGPAVVDLAGNVREWMLDEEVSAREPPWSGRGILIDPVGRSSATAHMIRGASSGVALELTAVSLRHATPSNNEERALGFRCVRPAR